MARSAMRWRRAEYALLSSSAGSRDCARGRYARTRGGQLGGRGEQRLFGVRAALLLDANCRCASVAMQAANRLRVARAALERCRRRLGWCWLRRVACTLARRFARADGPLACRPSAHTRAERACRRSGLPPPTRVHAGTHSCAQRTVATAGRYAGHLRKAASAGFVGTGGG